MRIRLNAKVAKDMGLVAAKNLKGTPKNSLLLNPESGEIVKYSPNKNYKSYYSVATPTDKQYKEYQKLFDIKETIQLKEKELAKAEKDFEKLLGTFQKKLANKTKSKFVIFIYVKHGVLLSPSDIKLRNNTILTELGIRYRHDGQDDLWIAIIENDSYCASEDAYDLYSVNFEVIKHHYTKPIKSTGYECGEKFLEGCSPVYIMNGKILDTPLIRPKPPVPTKEQLEANLEEAKNDGSQINIFIYKGILGIYADKNCSGIIAHPKNGNLGVVAKAEFVDISYDALEAIKKIKKSSDAIGDIDVFKSNEGPIVSWLGGYKRMLRPEYVTASRGHEPYLLKPKKNVKMPDDFIQEVDEHYENHN